MRVFPRGYEFSLMLGLAIFLGWMDPEIAEAWADLGNGLLSELVLVVIFMVQGWKMEGRVMLFPKLSELICAQFGIVFCPGLALFILWNLGLIQSQWLYPIIFLSLLPTTISSCVVYSREAGGDSVCALGNAVISNLLAPFILFLWWSYFVGYQTISNQSEILPLFKILLPKLVLLTLFPCLIGWALARNISPLKRHGVLDWILSKLPFLGIIMLVYLSTGEVLASYGDSKTLSFAAETIFPIFCLFTLVSLISGVCLFTSALGLRVKISLFFCFSQKSMVMGLPLLKFFSEFDDHSQARWLFPIIIYHFLQLFLGAPLIYFFRKMTFDKV